MTLPILVINLDGSPERLEKVGQQLQSIGQSFERIPAVDGRIMSEEERLAHYSPKKNKAQYHKALTPGEIGCYLSHRKAWQTILDQGLDAAIVLEDDIICQRDLTDVQTFVDSGFVFDYVKLSDHPNRPRKSSAVKMFGSSELVTFDKVPVRACAQIVSARGAASLLKNTETFGRPVDIDLQYWWEMEISVHGIKPFPFAPAPDVASDINAVQSRSGVKSHRLRRIGQQISFKLNNALRTPKI